MGAHVNYYKQTGRSYVFIQENTTNQFHQKFNVRVPGGGGGGEGRIATRLSRVWG